VSPLRLEAANLSRSVKPSVPSRKSASIVVPTISKKISSTKETFDIRKVNTDPGANFQNSFIQEQQFTKNLISHRPVNNSSKILTPLECIVKSQSLVRRWLAKRYYADLVHKYDRRSKVAHEILNSELNYIKSLDILKTVFLDPLRESLSSNKPILGLEKIGLIFSNIEFIRSINGELYTGLKARIDNWSPTQKLGDLFVEMAPGLQYAYSHYVNNYDQALKTLSYCQEKESSFNAFLEKNRKHPTYGTLSIGSFLIAPVQRLPRYELLLKEMVKYTPVDNLDYEQINIALSKIRAVTEFVNNNKKKAENLQKIISIQGLVDGNLRSLFHLNRILIDEGSFDVVDLKSSEKKRQHRYLYLFSDILLITKPIPKKGLKTLRYVDTVSLANASLQNLIPDCKSSNNKNGQVNSNNSNSEESPTESDGCLLIAPGKVYMIIAENKALQLQLFQEITSAISLLAKENHV